MDSHGKNKVFECLTDRWRETIKLEEEDDFIEILHYVHQMQN
jgi:hypothetical protein